MALPSFEVYDSILIMNKGNLAMCFLFYSHERQVSELKKAIDDTLNVSEHGEVPHMILHGFIAQPHDPLYQKTCSRMAELASTITQKLSHISMTAL